MTNEQIILGERMRLMSEGVIGGTGRKIVGTDDEGNTVSYDEPDVIHTYAGWKQRGYQVQKGQKAVASFPIWKHTVKAAGKGHKGGSADMQATTRDNDAPEEYMFMKTANFFSSSQVKPIQAQA